MGGMKFGLAFAFKKKTEDKILILLVYLSLSKYNLSKQKREKNVLFYTDLNIQDYIVHEQELWTNRPLKVTEWGKIRSQGEDMTHQEIEKACAVWDKRDEAIAQCKLQKD